VWAAKRPGVLLFGDFLLDKQEKVTQGAGAEPPAIRFSKSKAAVGGFWSFTTWIPAFAGMTTSQNRLRRFSRLCGDDSI
jgi:hypothetical protein